MAIARIRSALRFAPLRRAAGGCVLLGVLASGITTASSPVQAQSWWPWAQEAPRPREPVYRPPPAYQPPPQSAPLPGQQGQPGPPPFAGRPGAASGICLQLEQRLVSEGQRGNQSRDLLPKIEEDTRRAERALQQSQAQLERLECFEFFLFSKSLRRTPQCVQAANNAETARRQLAELEAQRLSLMGSRDRSFQDDIIRELARNGCGQQYTQEARRRDSQGNPFSSLWSEDDSPRSGGNQFGQLPFATYKTICVRLCDGYYFPVSFSTLPNHFQRDADVCSSRCAAPAELYFHQNPGAGIEQAQSVKSQTPYTQLKTAFRYRKEFVQGCSCKEAENTLPQSQPPADRKADAAPLAGPSTAANRAPPVR